LHTLIQPLLYLVGMAEFSRQEYLVSRNRGRSHGFTDFFFVEIPLSAIYVPVSGFESG
jgi:hypothetical protein